MSLSYVVRNATKDDLPAITSIIYDSDFKWFGNKRPKYSANRTLFTTYQTHRLVLLDPKASDQLIAYAEFRNYPNISAMASDSWLEWLQSRYCLTDDISSMNCLFFNFCIYSSSHPDAIAEAARSLFYREHAVRFLIAIKVSDRDDSTYYSETYTDLEKYAEGFYPHEFDMSTNTNMQSLFIIKRDSLMSKITFRKALPEDNDDIFEMHEYEYPEVRDQIGPYYIAEELLRQDEEAKSNILIVAEFEKESQLAGFLWLESDVDNFHLVRNYDLDIFGNLIKFNSKKPYNFRTEIVNSVERKSEAHLFTVDAMEDLEGNTILGGLQCNDSNISVASWTKLRVSSINDNTGDSFSKQNKFYQRESIYRKFLFIFEKMIRIKYYINQHVEQINLFYNTEKQFKSPDESFRDATNVFVLRYICVEKRFPLERLHTFLCAMFSAFPDRDYCIMSIPKSSGKLRSPLEALKYFMPVAQRPSNVSNLEEIYITHRSSIYGELSLYRLQVEDVQTIVSLATDSSRHGGDDTTRSSFSYNSKVDSHVHTRNEMSVIEQIMQDVLQNEDSEFDVFTIRCGNSSRPAKENTTIGYVILRRFLHHAELQFHYHLPRYDHLRSQRAEIISLKLHPLFSNTCEIILRTLAATTNYYDFYFIEGRKNIFSNDLRTMMMMLEPKRVKKYNFDAAEMGRHNKALIDGLPRHNFRKDHLVIFRHKLKPSRWFGNTNRLVIIGFTGLTKAILRQLVFMWNSTDHENSENYTCLSRLQVTVISGPGVVEAEYDKMFKCPNCSNPQRCYMCHDNSSCYLRDVVRRMDLRYWVHFVSGTVNYINRDKKYVKVNDSCEIFYDNLILSNSLRFCLQRCRLGELRTPCNFIEINNRIDKFLLFYKFRVLIAEQKHNYRIIVHGFNLDTYECISFLLSHGVAAAHLVLVIPRCPVGTLLEQKMTKSDVDKNLQYVLDDMLTDLGVEIHRDLDFQYWIQHGATQFIIEVVFAGVNTLESMKRFDCDLFISFIQGHMDYFTMRWLFRSGISLDCNTILVNQEFRTNDPDIYAVGSFVKITTPINYQHTYTSAEETAAKLLHFMGLRPYGAKFEYRYSKPSYFHALLPLGYNITKVTVPRRFLASYVVPCTSCPLTTYHEENFCRIVLSPKQMVEEIVVVSKNIDYYDYLNCFCGKHESMLNNLSQRYQDGLIPCLIKFLQEPWAELLMHEQFQDFQDANHKLLKPMFLSTETNKNVTSEQFGDVNKHILEHNLINFLRIHHNEFQHEYALPENFCPYNMRSTMTMHALKEYKLGTEDRKFSSMASEGSN